MTTDPIGVVVQRLQTGHEKTTRWRRRLRTSPRTTPGARCLLLRPMSSWRPHAGSMPAAARRGPRSGGGVTRDPHATELIRSISERRAVDCRRGRLLR